MKISPIKAALVLSTLVSTHALAAPDQPLQITRNGDVASIAGSPDNFVGRARIDPLIAVRAPSTLSAGLVTFEPGARSVWHTHPRGQTLVVTTGKGWIQQAGGDKQVIQPGDVVWIPAGVKHWHGATATTGMTHIAIQEAENGKNVDWMEPVSAADYEASR